MAIKQRTIRVANDLWDEAKAKADKSSDGINGVIVRLLTNYVLADLLASPTGQLPAGTITQVAPGPVDIAGDIRRGLDNVNPQAVGNPVERAAAGVVLLPPRGER